MEHKEKTPFSASIELLMMSPVGMLQCAADWLRAAKGDYRFEPDHPGLAAAQEALMAAPRIFVGCDGPSWGDSPRTDFWRLFFEAKAADALSLDLKDVVAALSKEELAMGAKEMMIIAARARDTKSFQSLLAIGAVRKSKLVMFSAYENGGKAVAELVKQPTAIEARELAGLGEMRWRRGAGGREHDAEGLGWLMGKCEGTFLPMSLAKLGSRIADSTVIDKVVELYKDRVEAVESLERVGAAGSPIQFSAEANARAGMLALASSGSVRAAKSYATHVGGDALWRELCVQGESTALGFAVKGMGAPHSHYTPEVCVGDGKGMGKRPPLTIQAACALSADKESLAWLREEYDKAKMPWAGSAELGKVYAFLETRYHGFSAGIPELVARAISASEFADMRLGIPDAPAVPAEPKARRACAL